MAPEELEVRAVQPPGRQNRLGEPPFTDVRALARAAATALSADLPAVPFGFFGHSVGAIVAFETAHELARRGLPTPTLLAVSAQGGPRRLVPSRELHRLSDEALVREVQDLGGLPAEVAVEPDLLTLLLPTLRADLTLSETYVYRPSPRLGCPISAFGGHADLLVRPADLRSWQSETDGPLTVRLYDGSHFYLWDAAGRILEALAEDLRRRRRDDRETAVAGA